MRAFFLIPHEKTEAVLCDGKSGGLRTDKPADHMSLESRLGLKTDERVVMTIRTAVVTVLPAAFFAAVFVLLPFFFLMPLLSWRTLGFVLMVFSFGIGLVSGLRTAVAWFGTMTVITDRRIFIVRREGLFARKVHSLPFVKMQGVSYRVKGLWQTVFRYGTVLIRPTAGKPLRIARVRRPALLEGLIAECIEAGEAGSFGDLLHAVDDMESRELQLLRAEIERSLRHRDGD